GGHGRGREALRPCELCAGPPRRSLPLAPPRGPLRAAAVSLTAVTGASGFLGAHVVRHWHATGRRVRGLYRRPPAPGVPGEVVVVPDLLDSHALRSALEEADTVLHLAARVHVTRETATDPL